MHRFIVAVGRQSVALILAAITILASPPTATHAAATLPPLPSRAIIVAADISASVPIALAQSTQGLLIRSLQHAYTANALDQGVPDTLIEWIAIGIDSYSPRSVILRAWIPGLHPLPHNRFLSARLRQQVGSLITAERRATTQAANAVIAEVARLHFHTEYGTDLDGAPDRFTQDVAAITGHRDLILSSDLLGAAPQADHVSWNMANTTAQVFEYCSQSAVDNAASCVHRQQVWTDALSAARATVQWRSSTLLDTLPYITF